MSESDSELEDKEIEWKRKVAEMGERLKTRLDENMAEGKREDNLYHGLKLVSSSTMIGKLREICYCQETQEYLVVDSPSNMLRYSVEGKLIQPSYSLSATMLFTKLLWCQEAKVLIGYLPNDDIIWLMTSFCMLYQTFRNDFRVTSVFYEPSTNEAIVVGANKITRLQLSNKESTINPSKTMSFVDSEYGTLWKLECLSIIPASTSILRMAGSYITTIYILPLDASKEREDGAPMFLARNNGATEAQITVLLFQVASQWVITGDEHGNVMGWDLELNCTMNCPGGHKRSVRQIVPHPSICGFVTCAEDNVLQIWSCNLRGKMESFSDLGEIWTIAVNESAAGIAALGQKLSCFNMHQLYTFYAALSESATQIISTMNPMYSTRVIVRSSDNSIRILTSPTGKQINIQILPKTLDLVSMAYSGNRERLYTIILRTGEILVSNTKTNPMELKHVWVPDGLVISCITAYEYYEEIRGPDRKPQNPRVIYPKYTLIFAGTEDGAIVNINESSGKHEGRFAAHNGSVQKLWSSTISRLVVSMGVDKCVKVWRVYADLAVPLALGYSVYYTVPITHVATMGSVLCMVSSTQSVLAHQLFMYNVVETVRLDHHPSKDHTELILDIAASESLQICATSSMDNTIRLWDQQNVPIKVLEINTCARNITFSSLRGDIVFGAGRHLYRISYSNYLSPKYRARILVNGIPEEIEEQALPEDKEYRIYEDEVDRELLLHPVSSTPLGSLDISGGDAPRLESVVQQQMCAQLQRRDQDITYVKNGEIKAVKTVADKLLMNHDTWEKYLEDILGMANRPGTEIQSQDFWAMVEKHKDVKRYYNKPGVFKMLYGYSIEKFPEYLEALPDSVQHPSLPLFGFLPNSVIYKLFSDEDVEPPPPMPEPKPLLKYQYPREFLMEQLGEIDSSGFDSNVEISPSQLLNMTNIKIDSDLTVVRASIPEDQSPFVRGMQHAIRCGHSSTTKKQITVQRTQCSSMRRKLISKAKTVKRKNKAHDLGMPSTIEKIIFEAEGKISSEKTANRRWLDSLSCEGLRLQNISHAGIAESTYRAKTLASLREDRVTKKKLRSKEAQESVKVKRSGKRGYPRCRANSKSISNETCHRTLGQKFTDINDLAHMSIKEVIAQKKNVIETLKNDYSSISIAHDNKIKAAVMSLLTRCMNVPPSFSAILNLLNVLPIDDIEIVAFLCTIFTVTSNKVIRKSVVKYLRNRGLRDPGKVLTRQLLVVRSLTNTSDIFAVTKFISQMITDWINTLEKHVALVAEKLKSDNDFKTVRNFLLRKDSSLLSEDHLKNDRDSKSDDFKESKASNRVYKTHQDSGCVKSKVFAEKRVISPIEGINYFCELNTKFSTKFQSVQRSLQD